MSRSEAFILVGTTAVGKTEVAQHLALQEGYEILSADSMLIYRGMDIGTAKPTADERARVTYHGLDLVSPAESYSAGQYVAAACRALAGARAPVIAVGGTGLYVKGLVDGLSGVPSGSESRRNEREHRLSETGVIALQEELETRNPTMYAGLRDKENPRRLIRALEMVDAGVTVLPNHWERDPSKTGPDGVGLRLPTDQLNSRIESRVAYMYDRGFMEEVEQLRSRYPRFSDTAAQAIGYQEVMRCLDGASSVAEAMERTVIRTRRLAKKQRTWFRSQMELSWIDITADMLVKDVADRVQEQWRTCGPTAIKGIL